MHLGAITVEVINNSSNEGVTNDKIENNSDEIISLFSVIFYVVWLYGGNCIPKPV